MVLAWGNTGQLGMIVAWVDMCVDLCWTLWTYLISHAHTRLAWNDTGSQ